MIVADQFPAKATLDEVDENGSGFISHSEFTQFLKKAYPGKP